MYLAKHICRSNESHLFFNDHPVIFHCFVWWLFSTHWILLFHRSVSRNTTFHSIDRATRRDYQSSSFFFSLNCLLYKLIAKFISDDEQNEIQIEMNFLSSFIFFFLHSDRGFVYFLENRFGGCQSMSNIIIINLVDHSVELMRSVHVILPQKDIWF